MAVTDLREPLDGVALSAATLAVFDIAATRANGHPISTADLVAGAMQVGPSGAWDAFRRGAIPFDGDAIADPEPEAGARWGDKVLSVAAGQALDTAVRVAAEHGMSPLSPGFVALGALSDPASGAARELMAHAGLSHSEMLGLLRRDVVRLPAAGSSGAEASSPTGSSATGALELLLEAAEAGQHIAGLNDLLDAMLLVPERLEKLVQATFGLEDEPAAQTRRRAVERFEDEDPDPAALIVAAALAPTPRMREALSRLGIAPEEVVAAVAEWRLRSAGDGTRDSITYSAAMLNGLVSVTTSVLIVMSAVGDDGHLWRLPLVYFAWVGYPQTGPVAAAVLAGMLALLASPAAGLAQLASIVSDALQATAERRALLRRTGVRLGIPQVRNTALRLLSPRARRLVRRKQAWTARVLARQDGREV